MTKLEEDTASWSHWVAHLSQSTGKNGVPVQLGRWNLTIKGNRITTTRDTKEGYV